MSQAPSAGTNMAPISKTTRGRVRAAATTTSRRREDNWYSLADSSATSRSSPVASKTS